MATCMVRSVPRSHRLSPDLHASVCYKHMLYLGSGSALCEHCRQIDKECLTEQLIDKDDSSSRLLMFVNLLDPAGLDLVFPGSICLAPLYLSPVWPPALSNPGLL